nr:MAG TPA: hypothetical protein [Caudoviricetes sp.]
MCFYSRKKPAVCEDSWLCFFWLKSFQEKKSFWLWEVRSGGLGMIIS